MLHKLCACLLLQGGESLIGDSAAIAATMPDFVLQRFADRGGIRYTRRYVSTDAPMTPDGVPALTWQERTGFTDPEAAAGFFKDLGFKVEWQEGDTLVATHVAPPVVPHPVTGQPVWFNLTHLAVPGYTEYADGSPIEPGRHAGAWVCQIFALLPSPCFCWDIVEAHVMICTAVASDLCFVLHCVV